jgi:lysine 6-dehydrogenase
MEHFDRPRAVRVRVGGLPQKAHPPLNYFISFSIAGLTNEYFGKAYVLRDGNVTKIDTFSELEILEFPAPVGLCEAFVTTGGTSTCPWTFEGKLEEYEEKTVRYPGHYGKFKTMLELGLLDEKPVQVGKVKVVPRDVFHAVVGPVLTVDEPRDVVVLRVTVTGGKAGREGRMDLEIMDFFDDKTRFSAMQRTTGFPAAIVAEMMARGEVAKGAVRLETAIDARTFVKTLPLRDIQLQEHFTFDF